MTKCIPKLILVACTLGLITGCASTYTRPNKKKEIEVHFTGAFDGQTVECVVDNKTLFKWELFKDPVLDVAQIAKALVSNPRFNLKVIIDGYTYSYDLNTDSGKYITFRIQEVESGDALMLVQTDEVILYE